MLSKLRLLNRSHFTRGVFFLRLASCVRPYWRRRALLFEIMVFAHDQAILPRAVILRRTGRVHHGEGGETG